MDGILIVSFGTSYRESRKKTIDVLVEQFKETFLDTPVYLAFTSKVILKKIYEEEQINIDTVEEALKRMYAEGISRVFIQPTHMINGIENEDMLDIIEQYRKLFEGEIFTGTPLLTDVEDYRQVLDALVEELEENHIYVSRETCETSVLLMGHGTSHYANAVYPAFDYLIKENGYVNLFVGTVEGYPNVDTVLKLIKRRSVKKIVLVPFMFVAGEHARNDMAGEDEGSWKNVFEREGYEVECVMKGMGEYRKIRGCYVEHLRRVMGK
jgi:sirohydrochlorin cobaltochelatase